MSEEYTERHFAPYGSTNARCYETVPRSVAWDIEAGDYADPRFTVKRTATTCVDCRLRAGIGADEITGERVRELQAENERLRGECACGPWHPNMDGPNEACPVHGREYGYWVERSDRKDAILAGVADKRDAAIERAEAAEAAIERVRAVVDDWEAIAGPGSDAERVAGRQVVSVEFAVRVLRAALDGDPS